MSEPITICKNSKVRSGDSLDKWVRKNLSSVIVQKFNHNIRPCTFKRFLEFRLNLIKSSILSTCEKLKKRNSEHRKLRDRINKRIHDKTSKLFLDKFKFYFFIHSSSSNDKQPLK